VTDDPFEYLRECYVAGDKTALARVLLYASMFLCPIPEWAAEEFKAAYERIERGDAASWDDVFGRPHPAKKHLFSVQLNHRKYEIWSTVRYLRKQGKSLGEAIKFVANTACISEGTIRRLYYAVENDARHKQALREIEAVPPVPAQPTDIIPAIRLAEEHAEDLRQKGDLTAYKQVLREIEAVRSRLPEKESTKKK
jgi:hypothetical protein